MWKFVGKPGEHVHGVPARDLSDEEMEPFLASGLIDPKAKAHAKLYKKESESKAAPSAVKEGSRDA